MRCRFQVNYKVRIYNYQFSEAILTSENFSELYDAKQFIYWLACQISTPIPYQIVMDVVCDGYTFHKELPKTFQEPISCKYYPPRPLTRFNQRQRVKTRIQSGMYYEY